MARYRERMFALSLLSLFYILWPRFGKTGFCLWGKMRNVNEMQDAVADGKHSPAIHLYQISRIARSKYIWFRIALALSVAGVIAIIA